MPRASHTNHGFTLAETLIVITILVILGTLALINVNPLTQFLKGYDTVRKADLAKIKTAFEAYYTDHDCYPSSSILSQCGSDALAPYLASIPCDPTGIPYTTRPIDGESLACPQKYAIISNLANKFDPRGDLIPYCSDTIAINSTEIKEADIVKICNPNKNIADTYYGCINKVCVIVAQNGDVPPSYCRASFTDSNCKNQCNNPSRACTPP